MPFTPVVSRPISRTSCSWKRIERPWRVASTMSFVPARDLHVDQLVAVLDLDRLDARWSAGSSTATAPSSSPCPAWWRRAGTGRRGTRAPARSPGPSCPGVTLIRLTIGLPLAARPACGISCTLSQKQRPSSVKTRMYSCVLADEQVLDEVLVLERLPVEPAAAAPLLLVRRHRRALDVARVRDGDHHLLVGDQVLDRELALVARDLRAALVAVLVDDLLQLAP